MSIRITGLTRMYGDQKAVHDLTFTARRGRILGFLGPNGAGKSTTMKIATGYLEATSGEVLINDVDVAKNQYAIKKMIGYLPEHNPLYLDMYVREFLLFIARAYSLKRPAIRIQEIVEQCGLQSEAHKKIRMLSKGFRQRVGLAKALLADPDILILDEPTTGLDPNQIVEIRNLIREASADKTVVLSTHIMQEVEAICDEVVIIDKGKLLLHEDLDNLYRNQGKNTRNRFQLQFDEKTDHTILENWDQVSMVDWTSDKLVTIGLTEGSEKQDILQFAAQNGLPLSSVKVVGSSLEEIFQSLTGAGEAAS